MVEIISESLLEQRLRSFDLEHMDWSDKQYKEYALKAMDSNALRELLIEDLKYRKEHGLNIVASCDGWQGKGKSLFQSSFGMIVGKIFGHPFKAENVYYSPIDLDFRLESQNIEGETFLRDEHRYSNHGEGSRLVNENLADYEEQLRITQTNLLFASVKAQDHAHFFWFEAKQTNFDPVEKTPEGKPKPLSVTAVLKTPLYTERDCFVWRGLITLPVPPMEYLQAYDKRKRDYTQRDLREKGDNALAQIKPYAEKVIKLREEDLIKRTRDGFVNPQKEELIKLIVAEVIGSRKFTVSGSKSMFAYIQDELKKKYLKHNEQVFEGLEKKRQAQFEQRIALLDERRREDKERRLRKEELQKMKMDIERERVRLKKDLYEMRKKGALDDELEEEEAGSESDGQVEERAKKD
jgi:hypothetical protein